VAGSATQRLETTQFRGTQLIVGGASPNCNRFQSGQQITNAGPNAIEGGPPRTCVTSMEGDRPWGPATEQRFPVIDAERGVVFGVTLLH